MKKLLICLFLCALLLTACVSQPEITDPSATVPSSTEPATTTPTEPPTTVPTEPPHSDLCIPGVDVNDVIGWFCEVNLAAEFVHSGDPSYLQKWVSPIFYYVQGNPTNQDLAVLETFTQWLNTLEGFPGISETDDPIQANLNIHFCEQSEMLSLMGDWTYDLDGAVTFWYNDNRIDNAIICVRTDVDQQVRNSVILEELYNGLGPIQDTSLREDSLIYAGYSIPQELTIVDELILRLLYHPNMECGMTLAQCEEIIRNLYY